MSYVDCILLLGGVVVALPVVLFALETLAAVLSSKGRASPWSDLLNTPSECMRPAAAIIIPAHNEERLIAQTIASIRPQMAAGDRILVVADNCDDQTVRIARNAWAQVIERRSDAHRGKGYALAAGIEALSDSPPGVVVIVDADTIVSPGSLNALICCAADSAAPAQANYLLAAAENASPKMQVSALAFMFKNRVRAIGAETLGVPCMLRGTGMAFPWSIIRDAKLATGNIVEDMQLGVDLAIQGLSPRFCANARVTGELPESHSAAAVQRTRWEHGHLQTILHNVPKLLWQGIRPRRLGLLLLAADISIPPLALLVTIWGTLTLVALLANRIHWATMVPFVVLLCGGGLLFASILAGWVKFGRHLLPIASFLSIPVYILWKIPLYFAFLFKRQKVWVRTERM